MNINLAINEGSKILKNKLIPNPTLDAEILMAKTINKDRNYILLNSNYFVNKNDLNNFYKLIHQRSLGNPVAYLTKKIIPFMREQKSGKIINMSSMGGKVYTPFGAWYHATKYALEGWSDCLRIELKSFGVDVILIEPGVIKTEFQDVMMDSTVERSIGTPYEKKLKALEKATQEMYARGIGSPPSTITKLIIKAINSHNPKRRYVGGLFAKPMLFIKKWFGDKMYEKAIMSQIKKAKKE